MTEPAPRVRFLDHLTLNVRDIPEAVRFYTQVLGMRGAQFTDADGARRWGLKFGQQKINLHQIARDAPDPEPQALCFLTDLPLAAWVDHLAAYDVDVETGPVAGESATGPMTSISLRDPVGNLIEIGVPEI